MTEAAPARIAVARIVGWASSGMLRQQPDLPFICVSPRVMTPSTTVHGNSSRACCHS